MVRNQQAPVDKITAPIEDLAVALLSASPTFVLPSALPTHVYPVSGTQRISVETGQFFTVEVSADLEAPIKLVKGTASIAPTVYSLINNTYPAAGLVMNEDYNFYFNATSGSNHILWSHAISNSAPEHLTSPSTVVYIHTENLTYVGQSVTYPIASVTRGGLPYVAVGPFTGNMAGTILLSGDTAYTSNLQTVINITQYDTNFVRIGNVTSLAGVLAAGDLTFDMSAVVLNCSYVEFSITSNNNQPAVTSIITTGVSLNTSTINYSTITYAPMSNLNNWNGLVDVSTRWNLVAASLVVKNTASALANGGTVAIALLPTGVKHPSDARQLFNFISTLPYNKYNGPAKTGAHVSYIGDDISQYFFKSIEEPNYPTPKLVAAFLPATYDGSQASSLIEINMVYEFVTADQSRKSIVSPGHTQLFETMIGSMIRSCMIGDDLSLAGCNPDHIKRIKNIAKKIAKDPNVREIAKSVLSSAGKAAIKYSPLLLSALAL